eukprot:4592584-Pyramimonas_sp.AAC.1
MLLLFNAALLRIIGTGTDMSCKSWDAKVLFPKCCEPSVEFPPERASCSPSLLSSPSFVTRCSSSLILCSACHRRRYTGIRSHRVKTVSTKTIHRKAAGLPPLSRLPMMGCQRCDRFFV